MKIVFAASEMMPLCKTGGLADVVGTLAAEVRKLGHEVFAFLPRYKAIRPKDWGFDTVIDRLEVPVSFDKEYARVLGKTLDSGVTVYLLENNDYYNRDGLYGTNAGDYPDNDRRFIFFQRGILETLKMLNIHAHVIHCHDWQTGLIPVYLKSLYQNDPVLDKTKSIFTIHNLGYQGNFPPDTLPLTGFDWKQFKIDRLEYYGKVSFIKGGILDADKVTTVSARYAQEIQSKEFGCGFEGVLSKVKDRLTGIVNGIDLNEWNPETDPDIAVRFGTATFDKKAGNKTALQKEHNFKVDSNIPMLGVISRLVDQKGVDILLEALDGIFNLGFQLVLLGTGEEKYHHALRDIAKKNRERLGVHILFDPKMAKRIYAGADMMVMPSYYEPCGLGQMIALRYGTIPVVRATGGLADTIQDFDLNTGKGNGFSFSDYSGTALLEALERALRVYRNSKFWDILIINAMNCDFSWTASAVKYLEIYEKTKKKSLLKADE